MTSETGTHTESPFAISQFWLIIILGLLTASGPLTIDMYLPALPSIATDLNTSTSNVQQTLSIYFLGMALGQLFYGPLSDRFGRKFPLQVGLFLYLLATLGCAFAPNINTPDRTQIVSSPGGMCGCGHRQSSRPRLFCAPGNGEGDVLAHACDGFSSCFGPALWRLIAQSFW